MPIWPVGFLQFWQVCEAEALVPSLSDVFSHQAPRAQPTLKGVGQAGTLNQSFTGKKFSDSYLPFINSPKLQEPYWPYGH